MKKELMDKNITEMKLTEVLSVANDGFWEGFSNEMKKIPIYYGATMLTVGVIWVIAKHINKKNGDNKD